MGKIVLYLADGTTLDVPLDRERVTIGRRADNDVCLPYPAVSGEHAAVVTILADSFLEDMGSTNGTIVNGMPIAKHFLRDHDQLDIGRQRMIYLSDNAARVEPLPVDALRQQMRGLTDLVTPASRPLPKVSLGAERRASGRSTPILADLEREMASDGENSPQRGANPDPAPVAKSAHAAQQRERSVGATPRRPRGDEPRGAVIATEQAGLLAESVPVERVAPILPPGPCVRVLSGPSLGRVVPFQSDELSVGRVGVQVALVRKIADGFRLVPVEGAQPPRINGVPVPTEGAALHPGDTFEVAGVRLELSPQT